MGRQKDGPKQKAKSPNLFVQLHDLFSLFIQNYTFWRFTGHDGFLYLRTLPSLCDAYRKECGQTWRKKKKKKNSGELEK